MKEMEAKPGNPNETFWREKMQTLQNLSPLMGILDPCHYHSIPSDWPLEFSYTVTQNIK